MAAYTPMIQQYLTIKADYQDAFLFFRLGDFYEMFFDDALKASQELEITLTSRDGGGEGRIPMCGVPYHSAAGYIETLIERGYKVAICEQVEDPKQTKGVVKREVVQLITPGTIMQGKGIEDKENNFIASISLFENGSIGLAYTDLSTGENKVTSLSGGLKEALNELASIGTKEVVVDENIPESFIHELKERFSMVISIENNDKVTDRSSSILSMIQDESLKRTTSRLLNYLFRTQNRSLDHLQEATTYETNHFLKIDFHSKRNLEITETIRTKGRKGSLLWLMDETKTAMGGRMLKSWMDKPLINRLEIERRQSIVESLIANYFERQDLREALQNVYDLERLSGRVAFGNVNARDLMQLKRSLSQVPFLIENIRQYGNSELGSLAEVIDPCEDLADLLENAIVDNPPLSVKDGNIIRDGFNNELDQYRDASRNGKTWMAALEKQERERTGIKSLKIGYNRIFGYYIEITRANLGNLEEGRYERKQTLSNAERFITPELKEKEALILQAEEKIVDLEYQLFLSIREEVKGYIPRLQRLARTISEIDVLQCFATISETRKYVKPTFTDDRTIFIEDGRHPVVEKVMKSQEYVPNDCYMNSEREILLITGPNMSGKSTFMRQVALTAILAQAGCFVPASKAVLPVFDQIFTRIGAADDLIAGQSTFMVEMLEAKNAIIHATKDSLILFDEIGRGTSTYDGMALAQAIIEYIHQNIGAKTLFSTHYHELTDLENELASVHNIHVSAVEQNGTVVFLHKIKDGPADQSYGIHVAQLAELPDSLIIRAKEILVQLEQMDSVEKPNNSTIEIKSITKEDHAQLSFFEQEKSQGEPSNPREKKILQELQKLNILEMTPMDAMNTLYKIQKELKS
ncbi:DNA mismatch repair protein MutS [Peribacillus alkalitolerans]|uniref:DNA mismatch repair protein MutS n=1 Tax=Peribacillus alkalitolerans TaxID=1550385 RepID=UPI0013D845AD|nr:DNA mismatch repair protein MutS [Peribacillus alkalitolerans]